MRACPVLVSVWFWMVVGACVLIGTGQLLESGQIGKMIASFIGENKTFEKMYLTGDLSLELTPQGSIAEKCAAGAAGVPAFYTPAAYGTIGWCPISGGRIWN